MVKHGCRICRRSFPSGRSLGGHMRSHIVQSSSMEAEQNPGSRYGLRDNPAKSRRFEDSSPKKDKVFAKVGKGSSFEIPGDELKKEKVEVNKVDDDLWRRGSYQEEEEEMQSQSSSEVTVVSFPTRKQWRRARRTVALSSSSSPPESLPEYDKEQEDGALCLLMLSKGAGFVTDSSEKPSKLHPFRSEPVFSLDDDCHGFQEFKNSKALSFSSDGDDHEFQKPKASSFSSDLDHGDFSSIKSNQCDFESTMQISSKRNRYNCTICDKSFQSYQALGGHRASHKRMRGDQYEFINRNHVSQPSGRSPENPGRHDCSICGKVFASGQALGGHKRSHVVAANASASYVRSSSVHGDFSLNQIENKASKLRFIDLNLPACDEDC